MKLSSPKLALPKRKPKGASSSGGLKPPKFIGDLYADLRDRRLLPLVALLLIAIVATPILLSGSSEEEAVPVAPPVGGASEAAAQASFSVVPAQPGLREPDKRLGYRQARDPFKQPTVGGEEVEVNTSEVTGVITEGASESGPAQVETAPVEEPPATAEQGSTQVKTEKEIVVEHNVVDYTVDVNAGYVDQKEAELGVYKEQAAYTQLPNAKKPVVVYMGVTPDQQHALFLMTNEVIAYYGVGTCALDKESCQLLELKPGQSETFAYGLEERPYKLTLKKINRLVSTESSADSKSSTKKSEDGSADKEKSG